MTKLVSFVDAELKQLPAPGPEVRALVGDAAGLDRLPSATFRSEGVEIVVRFLPMKPGAAAISDPDASIVGMGPVIGGMVNSGARLRSRVSQMAGGRYAIGDAPFLVAVGLHDPFCSEDQIIDGLGEGRPGGLREGGLMDRQTKRWIGYGVGAVIASVVLATFGIVWPAVIFTVVGVLCSIQARRSAAHGRASTSKPWNPDVGPFIPMRGQHHPFVWVLGTTAVAAYVLLFAFRERAIPGTVLFSVVFLAIFLACRPDSFSPGLDVAVPVPPDAPVNESGSPPWPQAVVSGLFLLSPLLLLGMVLDWDVTWLVASTSLGEALDSAIRARSIARWEEVHGVEILRAARTGPRYRQYLAGSSPTHLYVRPRPAANGDATGRTEP